MVTGGLEGHRPGELVTISRSLWADTVDALHTGDPSDLQSVLHRLLAAVPAGTGHRPERDLHRAAVAERPALLAPEKPGRS